MNHVNQFSSKKAALKYLKHLNIETRKKHVLKYGPAYRVNADDTITTIFVYSAILK